MALALAGCSAVNAPAATGPAASSASAPSASVATAVSSQPLPSPSSPAPSSPCLPLPHKAPAFERELPSRIGGRQLDSWSMDGELLIRCFKNGSDASVAGFAADLATEGLTLDDVAAVVVGRSDRIADPPYFILAYRMAGHTGSEWPAGIGVDYPDAANFIEKELAGKTVLVGDLASIDQSEHARGRPYVWNSDTTHYVVVTDDEAWASEALRMLH